MTSGKAPKAFPSRNPALQNNTLLTFASTVSKLKFVCEWKICTSQHLLHSCTFRLLLTHCQGLDLHPLSSITNDPSHPHPSSRGCVSWGDRNCGINDSGKSLIMAWINDEKFGVNQQVPKHSSPRRGPAKWWILDPY